MNINTENEFLSGVITASVILSVLLTKSLDALLKILAKKPNEEKEEALLAIVKEVTITINSFKTYLELMESKILEKICSVLNSSKDNHVYLKELRDLIISANYERDGCRKVIEHIERILEKER